MGSINVTREKIIFLGEMNDENESFGSGISRIYESNSISGEAQSLNQLF